VDLGRAGAVTAAQRYDRDILTADMSAEYEQVNGHWLPRQWTVAVYGSGGELLSSSETLVTEVAVDPPVQSSDFELAPRPNSVLAEGGTGELFRVGSDGEQLTKIERSLPVTDQGPSGGSYLLYGVTIMAMLLLLLALVGLGRTHRGKAVR